MAAPTSPLRPPGEGPHFMPIGERLRVPLFMTGLSRSLGKGTTSQPINLSMQDHEVEQILLGEKEVNQLENELEGYTFGLDPYLDQEVRGLKGSFQYAKAGAFLTADGPALAWVSQRWGSLKDRVEQARADLHQRLSDDPNLDMTRKLASDLLLIKQRELPETIDDLMKDEFKLLLAEEKRMSKSPTDEKRLAMLLKYRDFIYRLQMYLPK